VLDAPDVAAALARLGRHPGGVALAIAGGAALSGSPRALAAGVREIHDRPAEWRPYAALIGTLVARFIPAA
jgi:hypothetical protein